MALVLNGDGNVTGLTAGGLPDASITQSDLAAGIAGNGPAFAAYQVNGNANQSISSDVWTKALLDTEEYDTNSNFSSGRFTPTVAGYYQINGTLYLRNAAACALKIVALFKNGSTYKQGTQLYFNGNYYIAADCFGVSTLVYMNGSTDYVELYGYISSASASIGYGSTATWFNGYLARTA